MSYQIIRGSKGFVSCVEKIRVRNPDGTTSVREKAGGRVCGLGNMTHEEFFAFRAWANSFDDQEERKAMVLSSGRAVKTKETAVKKVAEHAQKKTTVQRPPAVTQAKLSKEDREKELKEQEKRVIVNMTPQQKEKRIKDLIDDQKDLQQKFRKISGIKEDIKKDNIKNPHHVSGNIKKTLIINAQIKENKNKRRIINKEKQLYKDSLKCFGGRW